MGQLLELKELCALPFARPVFPLGVRYYCMGLAGWYCEEDVKKR
jgi:hypothetical protein